MTDGVIPEKVRQFIFEKIDSVEQLEILLFLRLQAQKEWAPEDISKEFRSSLQSVVGRLKSLEKIHMVGHFGSSYRYEAQTEETENMLEALDENYKKRRQKILELIFSPTKKARALAHAFVVNKEGE